MRTGRPTTNPKNQRVGIRLDEVSARILDKYSQKYNVTKSEIVRKALIAFDESDEKGNRRNQRNCD